MTPRWHYQVRPDGIIECWPVELTFKDYVEVTRMGDAFAQYADLHSGRRIDCGKFYEDMMEEIRREHDKAR